MMRICLTDGGKRFHRDWVFRHADMDLLPGRAYAITGPNGSGKSTLLQVLGGMTELSAGRIEYFSGDKRLEPGDERAHISFAAPYLETVEEMTGVEFLTFHAGLRPLLPGHTPHSILADVGLTGAADKQVRHYSSGMKQRLRLAQAFYSAGGALLLDEPCTNLDRTGVAPVPRTHGKATRRQDGAGGEQCGGGIRILRRGRRHVVLEGPPGSLTAAG